jgi:hypothetical protein
LGADGVEAAEDKQGEEKAEDQDRGHQEKEEGKEAARAAGRGETL